jgi:hypothetical protein
MNGDARKKKTNEEQRIGTEIPIPIPILCSSFVLSVQLATKDHLL